MSYDFNQQDIELLNKNPHQLILNNQKLIDTIICLFIRSGQFRPEEYDEVKQQVNESLLKSISNIRNQFQGKSLFKTYLSIIIKNLCKEILRKKNKPHYILLDDIYVQYAHAEAINSIVFEEEMTRLQKAIELYYKQKWKLLLCLKLKFKMPFNYNDFSNMNKGISKDEFDNFVQRVMPFQDSPDVVIFTALTDIINRYENKNNSPDALRKWIKSKIDELIDILNGEPPTSHYNEETFQILFEKCYHDEKEMVSKIL